MVDARFVVALVMLAGASWSDLRTRRVPNMYWLPFLAAALVFAFGDVAAWRGGDRDGATGLEGGDLAVAYGVAAVLCAAFYGIWRLHLFGGADAKGLMVLALLMPWPKATLAPIPVALDALANASLLMLAFPFLYAALNLVQGRSAFPALLLGRVMALDRAERQHVWPLQRVLPGGVVGWRYFHRPGEELGETYRALRDAGVRSVWVTPKIPFMVPLAAGLVVTWSHGNLLLRLVEPYVA